MNSPLKIVFAGTPEFAASTLQAVLTTEHQIVACYTQPDRPAGRGRKLTPSPVKSLAQEQGIPVFQPLNFKQEEDVQQLAALNADIMVVVAYGLILPQTVLNIPRLGCINVHASLLPRWRGAAPIQRAIAAGDNKSGVTIMQMDIGLDTGDMLLKTNTPILPNDTGGHLHDRLAEQGGAALIRALNLIHEGQITPESQNNAEATYAHKLSKEEARLDWSQSAESLHNIIRAFNPWPTAHTQLDGKTIRIWQADVLENPTDLANAPGTLLHASKKGLDVVTGQGVLQITELQLSGGKRLPVSAILNSKADWFVPGIRFQ